VYEPLFSYCKQFVELSDEDLLGLQKGFKPVSLKKKAYLMQEEQIVDFVVFVLKGVLRVFMIKDGEEKTLQIVFENNFFTDFKSFNTSVPTLYEVQTLEDCQLLILKKQDSSTQESANLVTLRLKIAKRVATLSAERNLSLIVDKPEERYEKLLALQPDLFQRVPQKYIANMLGITPESLSRIRKRLAENRKS